MRFKLPPLVQGVSIAGKAYQADEPGGVIDTGPPLNAEDFAEMIAAGAVGLSEEEEEGAKGAIDERDALVVKLADLGIPIDARRRYPLAMLRALLEDASEVAKADAPAAKAAAKAVSKAAAKAA